MTILEDMMRALEGLDLTTPRAHQIRAGAVAAPALPYALVDQYGATMLAQQFSGIPIIVDHQLPPFGWKLVDQYGATMLEGELSIDLDI